MVKYNLKNESVSQYIYRLSFEYVPRFGYAAVTTLASLLVSSLAGYGFEIYHDRDKDLLMNIFAERKDVKNEKI